MSHLQVYLSMDDRLTKYTELIVDVTLWIAFMFIVYMVVINKISSNPDTVQLKLKIPFVPVALSRNWPINYPVSKEEIHCMALNIYFEARGESIEAQYAVADVVMYRLMHVNYPNTICGVVKDGVYPSWNDEVPFKWRCSFTWHCDRKSDIPHDIKAFVIAEYIADDVITNPTYEPEVNYALFYHASNVNPYWIIDKIFVTQRGAHLFYMNKSARKWP